MSHHSDSDPESSDSDRSISTIDDATTTIIDLYIYLAGVPQCIETMGITDDEGVFHFTYSRNRAAMFFRCHGHPIDLEYYCPDHVFLINMNDHPLAIGIPAATCLGKWASVASLWLAQKWYLIFAGHRSLISNLFSTMSTATKSRSTETKFEGDQLAALKDKASKQQDEYARVYGMSDITNALETMDHWRKKAVTDLMDQPCFAGSSDDIRVKLMEWLRNKKRSKAIQSIIHGATKGLQTKVEVKKAMSFVRQELGFKDVTARDVFADDAAEQVETRAAEMDNPNNGARIRMASSELWNKLDDDKKKEYEKEAEAISSHIPQ
ncbi:hypothetical protein C8J56DRAFT_1069724 [Mycena floridula]|nr:hypothetical protein C8J56DRAFT_1069724 [Mycena floridula]